MLRKLQTLNLMLKILSPLNIINIRIIFLFDSILR